jgi:hypothetical protein
MTAVDPPAARRPRWPWFAPLAAAVARDLTVLRYAVDWRLRPDIPADAAPFTCHKSSRLLVWSLLFVAVLEIAAAHALISIWSVRAALTVSLLSGVGVVYLLGLANSFARLPLLVSARGVRVRAGLILDQWVGFDEIASVEAVVDCGDPKRPGFLKASGLVYPNVVLRLRAPMTIDRLFKGPKTVEVIGLHPDEPTQFVRAVRAGG